ncbi:MAG: hypothetical protein F4X15_03275 [Gemmatimonadetes bacterium]|nr:hypothetical protein [Gemmatimonadota bacterium]
MPELKTPRRATAALAVLAAAFLATCYDPQPPAPCGTVPEQTIHVGNSATVTVCFSDPNEEDVLTFAATSSDPGVATVAATGSTVTVTAVSPGTAVVSMTATDPGGLMARQSFRVVVPNRAPTTVGTIEDRELMVGDSATLDVARHFSEPDGQELTYTAAADSARLAVSIRGSRVTLTALAKGTVTVTVTATDPGGLAAVQSFRVTVPNRAPVAVDSIPPRTIEVDHADTLDVSPLFADPDGDTLIYSAEVSDSSRVAASIVGGALTVTALAKGEAVVTVTATDDEGATATHSLHVTVPNRPPAAVDTIPPLTLFKDEADTLELAPYFNDPDGDPLTFVATSSDRDVVAVTGSAGTLIATAVSQGEALVTVTATDDEGLTAQQSFEVTVPNRAPAVAITFPAQDLFKRDSLHLDLAGHFTDPDGDSLTLAAVSSDGGLATATITRTTLTVRTAAITGEATITVTATDPGDLSARQSFTVTVRNRAPVATSAIPDLTLNERTSRTLGVSPHFEDPDGDPLTYTAESSNTRVATVRVAHPYVIVRGVRQGEAVITVTATDPVGASAAQAFAVTVDRPIMNFNIGLGFAASVTASQERVFSNAAAYWQRALRFTEFDDIAVNATLPCPIRGITVNINVETIDDIAVVFLVADLDGEGGTAAVARLCYIRSSDETPLLGIAIFDRADIDRIARAGNLREIAIHEIAHVLGFGSGPWLRSGLVRNPSETDPTADTHFSGARAIAAFNAAGGSDYAGPKVPVQNGGDDSHWRESVLGHELMTPTATLGVPNPPSAVTLQSFADLGFYSIDASHAESYRLPEPALAVDIAAAAEAGAEVISFENDVEHGPILVLDSDGKVVRVIGEEAALRALAGPEIHVILREER